MISFLLQCPAGHSDLFRQSDLLVKAFEGMLMNDIDASIVTDYMVLGVGTCWLTYFDPEVVRRELNIP